jgi:hypothetical protein
MVTAIDSKTVLDRVITEPTCPSGVVTSVGAGQHTLSVKQDNQPGSCDNRLRVDFAEVFTALGWRSIGQPPLQDHDAAPGVVHCAEVRPDNAGANGYVPTDAELANFPATAPPCFSPCKEAP